MKISIVIICLLVTSLAHAYSPILHDFHSVRAAGMGDIRYTTGLYEENFFANPARVTANPENLFQLPKLSFEAGSSAIGTIGELTKSSNDGLSRFSSAIGKPLSARTQLVFPAFYKRNFLMDYWSYGIGFIMSAQTVAGLGQSGVLDPTTVINMGPAFTLGRRLLPEHRLSLGITARTEYRLTSGSFISVSDFLNGTNVSKALKGGSGMGIDFDLGTSFKPHWGWLGFQYEIGAAINNLLGGKYKNLGGKISGWDKDPIPANISYNLGVSATKKNLLFLDSFLYAIELSDLGPSNMNGSIFRNIHLGTESKWRALAARLGVNQGYYTAGLGLNLHYIELNLATYGEELGLNAGIVEDRRYALQLGFQI